MPLPFPERLFTLRQLGREIERDWLAEDEADYGPIAQAVANNSWFTQAFVRTALKSIASMLASPQLDALPERYSLEPAQPKRIGLVMAGNLPLVGFHDLMCVLLAGHIAECKLSDKDTVLMQKVLATLAEINPAMGAMAYEVERIKNPDAVIATGGNNTGRYFDYYFGKYPHIIRRNRNSVGVIGGDETQDQLNALADDIFLHFGLGCRSVSLLWLPEGFKLEQLHVAFGRYDYLANLTKWGNNLDYHRALYLMNLLPFYDMGHILIREGQDSLHSPVAQLNVLRYSDKAQVLDWLKAHEDEVQITVSIQPWLSNRVAPGQAQCPSPLDFADGVDTLQFLSTLSKEALITED